MKPILAIVGRPNVGKSTLFNRILGKRQALTLDISGMTRDRHYGDAFWDGRDFICIDTGGFPSEQQAELEQKVSEQIRFAIAEADVVCFVVDGHAGCLPEEAELARTLRKSEKPVIVAVNKVDVAAHEERSADFYALGFDHTLAISAEHGRGIGELLDAVIAAFPPARKKPAEHEEHEIRLSLVGRPNVGKSSLLNQLLGRERAVVSAIAGTTRDALDTPLTVDGQRFLMIDTAGLRRHGKMGSREERFSILAAMRAVDRSHIALLILDAAEGLHKQDAHVADYLAESGKGIIVLWNKWDLVPSGKQAREDFEEKVAHTLRFIPYAPRLYVSAKTGQGCEEILPRVQKVFAAYNHRVKTPEMNRVLEHLIDNHPAPVYQNRPLRFYYGTQSAVRPPVFSIFTNRPEGVPESFKRYLIRGLRQGLDLTNVPIRIHFKKRH